MSQKFSDCVKFLRFLLPCLVVFRHAPFPSGDITCGDGLEMTLLILFNKVLCLCAVPTFFMISGYYFFKGINEWKWSTYSEKIKRRCKTLLFPYLLWNGLFVLPIVCLYLFGVYDWESFVSYFSEKGFLRIFWDCNGWLLNGVTNILGYSVSIGNPLDAPLWFIRDLMIVSLCAPLWYYLIKHINSWVVLCIGVVVYLFNILPFSMALLFFTIGAFFMLNKRDPIEFFLRFRVLFVVMSLMLVTIATITYGNNQQISDFSVRLFRLFGIPVLFLFTTHFVKDKEKVDNFNKLSSYSFVLFAAHYRYVLGGAKMIVGKGLLLIHCESSLLNMVLVSLLSIVFIIVCFALLKKICPRLTYYLNGCRRQ